MRNTAFIDQVLASAVVGNKIAGLVAAAADADGMLYHAAFGRLDAAFGRLDAGKPARMTPDAVFRIASMTKAVTATAAMQMVEQGRLSLDQPARAVLPFLAETQVLDRFDA